MSRTAPQFNPQTQFDQALNEIDQAIQTARQAVDRLQWLKSKIAEDFDAMQRRADEIEIYTEAEAAAMFQIKPPHLADLRRRLDLPHVVLGSVIRYTKPQIAAIGEILSIGGRSAGKTTKLRKAA